MAGSGHGGTGAGRGGSAGHAGSGGAAGMEEAGAAGTGEACAEGDTGELALTITGLPTGVDADVSANGPASETATRTTTFSELASGAYEIAAEKVTSSDAHVRTLYEPTPATASVCVSGSPATAHVDYRAVPTSGKLWIVSSEAANLQGFAEESLGASNDDAPALALDARAGGNIVFDRDGNLWTFGPTLAEAPLLRYPRAAFGASGSAAPDRQLTIDGVDCLPSMRAMAFDPDGSLWVSTCGGTLFRLDANTLAPAEATVAPDATISGLEDNQDLAFDAHGNLWVVDNGFVERFDAARLSSSTSAPADAVLTVRDANDTQDFGASYLAFDAHGNLWVADFGANLIGEVDASDLAHDGDATVVSTVSIAISVDALLTRPAFDDEGGLWVSYSEGKVARFAPDALTVSTNPGSPTAPDVILGSDSIGYAGSVAFFPAAAGLPLYHAYP